MNFLADKRLEKVLVMSWAHVRIRCSNIVIRGGGKSVHVLRTGNTGKGEFCVIATHIRSLLSEYVGITGGS